MTSSDDLGRRMESALQNEPLRAVPFGLYQRIRQRVIAAALLREEQRRFRVAAAMAVGVALLLLCALCVGAWAGLPETWASSRLMDALTSLVEDGGVGVFSPLLVLGIVAFLGAMAVLPSLMRSDARK